MTNDDCEQWLSRREINEKETKTMERVISYFTNPIPNPIWFISTRETQDNNPALGKVIVKKTGENAMPLGKATLC